MTNCCLFWKLGKPQKWPLSFMQRRDLITPSTKREHIWLAPLVQWFIVYRHRCHHKTWNHASSYPAAHHWLSVGYNTSEKVLREWWHSYQIKHVVLLMAVFFYWTKMLPWSPTIQQLWAKCPVGLNTRSVTMATS